MVDKTLYNENSIESLSPLAFTRLRPQVYCGDTSTPNQLLVEIISNAVDEYNLGHGDKIIVTIDKDIVTVRDYGQGFLVNSMREDGKTILEAAFSVLNTSGKYRDDGTYEGTSLGSFGIGSKITTYLSHWLIVKSWRDNQYELITFKEGEFESRTTGKQNEPSGTYVEWKPSEEFFDSTEINIKPIKELFNTICCLCPGLTITLTYNGETTNYYSKNGLVDLTDNIVKDKELIDKRFIFNFKDGKNKLNLVMTYTSNYSLTLVPYVNTGLTESGNHITTIKTLITKDFNNFARSKKWLKDKDDNLTGDDIQEGMVLVFNVTAPNVAYDAQVKSRVTKIDMKPFTTSFNEAFDLWLNQNEKDVKAIVDKALNARKAREAARKAREAVRQPKEKGLKAKMALSDKFIDCVSKNPNECNLLLVEGKSAASSAVEARNAKTDCIYMLRGKIVSPLKQDVSKILANQEISDIVKVIGAGFGDNFDISKCNFDKIVITSDQDSDGQNIELLLITFFYTYMRPLVEAGKLYRAVTPLYIIRQRGNEYYCFSDDELDAWKQEHNGAYDLLRAKGLGELNAADLHKVCFENERYKRITISDIQKTTDLLDVLMGSAVEPRKQYIYNNATSLGFNFD